MKQGTANSSHSGGKTEPKSYGINPAATAEIGVHEVRTKHLPIYEGRGIEAPTVGTTIHKTGSQGKR